MIASGGVSGGFSSMIAGGNFMDGFRQGIIVSGLNHVASMVNEEIQENPLMRHSDEAISLSKFRSRNKGINRESLINQRGRANGGLVAAGPDDRYIFDPLNKEAVIDLAHMLVVGREGKTIGNLNEHWQALRGRFDTAYDPQDYYSNDLGYKFYNYLDSQIQIRAQEIQSNKGINGGRIYSPSYNQARNEIYGSGFTDYLYKFLTTSSLRR